MSPFFVVVDPGHGGLHNGVYQTPGKRSPQWADLPQLFEGVQNREIAAVLKTMLSAEGISFLDVAPDHVDVPLKDRVRLANAAYRNNKNTIYVSIHADAAGNGLAHHDASGISIYTSPGQTKSDKLASAVFEALKTNIGDVTKWRTDQVDGDIDKEEHFYVLTKTLCPSILCELGFFTNRTECARMHTQDWKTICAASIFEGIKKYYKL
jgi:N-acetylmuramoyl-L-alanine amidase